MIPILNIYYLLCYAWDKLAEGEIVSVHAAGSQDLLELFSKVFLSGIYHLQKRGIKKDYKTLENTLFSMKGKFNIAESFKTGSLFQGKLYCEYDELTEDILPNQILKAIMRKFSNTESLSSKTQQAFFPLLKNWASISDIDLQEKHFLQLRSINNDSFYDFMLKISELVHAQLWIHTQDGKYLFRSFVQDEKRMAALFEAFVRNFYKIEQTTFKVFRENIHWQMQSSEEERKYLPKMQTDISLLSNTRKIIIDTKYYKETFQTYYDSEKIHAQHLYQLFSYLKNISAKSDLDAECEGILLYPSIQKEIHLQYKYEKQRISIFTLNLAQPREIIHKRMLDILL